jgi:hypothetical protein
MIVGMLIMVFSAVVTLGDDDDPVKSNRAPNAPVILKDISGWQKETYRCTFYAVDPDGDQVYYDIDWEKIGDKDIDTCGPDDPLEPWFGPFESGDHVSEDHCCYKEGKYTITIRAKDIYDNIGPSSTITVTYSKVKHIQFPILQFLLERISNLLTLL